MTDLTGRCHCYFMSSSQTLAKHVMGIHMNALQEKPPGEGELSLEFLKKYIAYCRRSVAGTSFSSWISTVVWPFADPVIYR